ncbi:MAG: hypothetical protein HQM10_14720 [Candidatus Riflebacteria bacterium]|nr:hypothetical protein [Candidatus Riflebacteria bacterium]
MKKIKMQLFILIVIVLCFPVSASAEITQTYIRETVIGLAKTAASRGVDADIGPFVNYTVKKEVPLQSLNIKGFEGIKGNVKLLVGGRNFTAADVDSAEVPFYTMNGYGLTDLLHDGGEWPGTGGNTEADDGRNSFGNDWAGEFYDFDKNGHYPKAVLRYMGSHCYIFVPMMYFPTLSRGISGTEEETPAPKSEWGMAWPDTVNGERIYYAPATGAKSIDPRYVLGSDKSLARMKLKELADEFDGVIYPRMREWFGTEPDFDQDAKIYILLDDIQDGLGQFLGYFWAGNQFSRSSLSMSNEKELLYIDLFPNYVYNPSRVYGTIAHEFVHMIHFNEGVTVENGEMKDEERWLEEGFTQYGQYLYNKTHTSNLDEFIKEPDTILVEPRVDVWLGNDPFANYGASYLFLFYLIEKYGANNGPGFMRNLVRDRTKGIESLNNSLRQFNTTFDQVFSDWAIANFIDKTRKLDMSPLNDGKWGYAVDNDYDTTNNLGTNHRLPVKFSERVILNANGTARSANLNPWAADYIEISGNTGNLNIGFDGADGGLFKAAVIKRGPQVDPTVEYVYLSDKQSGNLLIQNYGAGSTYENLVMVPHIVSSGNSVKMNYVYSATFFDLKLALFPNPIYENELHVVVRTKDKFAATPRLQMTYNGEQGYLVMSSISDSIYVTNYSLKDSGEGTVEAFGTNSNGTILSNLLKFSAVYYPAKSQGLLSASFARLSIPEGALKSNNWVTISSENSSFFPAGIEKVSKNVLVTFASEKFVKSAKLSIPVNPELIKSTDRLGLFEVSGEKAVFAGFCSLEGATATADITKASEVFVGIDRVPPVVTSEAETQIGKILVSVTDSGTGIDAGKIEAYCGSKLLKTFYSEKSGKIEIDTTSLREGENLFNLLVSDKFGNLVKSEVSAQVVSGASVQDVSVYPNPARESTRFRCSFNGSVSSVYSVAVRVRDVAGDDVYETDLTYRGDSAFEGKWNLRNESGKTVANGVYYVDFLVSDASGESRIRKKLAVVK